MEDIIVKSKIDLNTYYKISLLVYLKSRTLVILAVAIGCVSYMLINSFADSWESWLWVLLIIVLYIAITPVVIYFGCRKNMKTSPYLREAIDYTINKEKIESITESVSSTSNWKFILKVIERKEFFLIMASARSFHYLPKDGFESDDKIVRFRMLVKEQNIKLQTN